MRGLGRTTAVGIALFGAAWASGVAEAHDYSVSATCERVVVSMTNYSAEPDNTNTVSIHIDGAPQVATTFGTTFQWSWTFTDPTVTHTYRVAVTATKYPQATFDTGVVSIQPCASSTTTTTTTTAPTTTTTLAAEPPVTTTTMAPTTMPSMPTTTAAPTTTAVAPLLGAAGPAGTTGISVAAVPPGGRVLPATGAEDRTLGVLAAGAALAMLVGGALVATTARRR